LSIGDVLRTLIDTADRHPVCLSQSERFDALVTRSTSTQSCHSCTPETPHSAHSGVPGIHHDRPAIHVISACGCAADVPIFKASIRFTSSNPEGRSATHEAGQCGLVYIFCGSRSSRTYVIVKSYYQVVPTSSRTNTKSYRSDKEVNLK